MEKQERKLRDFTKQDIEKLLTWLHGQPKASMPETFQWCVDNGMSDVSSLGIALIYNSYMKKRNLTHDEIMGVAK